VWELIKLANRHPRVNILQPGPGVGGHCIAVDPWFIVSAVPQESRLIHTARVVNDTKPHWVIEKVRQAVSDYLENDPTRTIQDVTIACYGLAFKADIDDLRESPALEIVKQLAKIYPGRLLTVEPHITELPASLNGLAKLVKEDEAQLSADISVFLVGHSDFKAKLTYVLQGKRVVDVCGLFLGASQLQPIST
jgi:UDP-N-acetyl-D-mannosaminuronic acid dehydrogenase